MREDRENFIQCRYNFGDGSGWSFWSVWTWYYLYGNPFNIWHKYVKTGEYYLKFVACYTVGDYASVRVTIRVMPNKSLEKDFGFPSNVLKIFLWDQPNLFPILQKILLLQRLGLN